MCYITTITLRSRGKRRLAVYLTGNKAHVGLNFNSCESDRTDKVRKSISSDEGKRERGREVPAKAPGAKLHLNSQKVQQTETVAVETKREQSHLLFELFVVIFYRKG